MKRAIKLMKENKATYESGMIAEYIKALGEQDLKNLRVLMDDVPDSMLLVVRRWPTGGSASGPLEICPSGSPEDRRWQPP